jgi:hypothetical protein
MIDLELKSLAHNAGILQIGAKVFKPLDGSPLPEHVEDFGCFSMHINPQDSYGHTSTSTMEWWSVQNPAVRDKVFSGTMSTGKALAEFDAWLAYAVCDQLDKINVWGNAASFDLTILGNAYRGHEMPIPWEYYNEMCFRALKNLYPAELKPAFVGSPHNAFHDAQFQAHWAENIIDYRNSLVANKPQGSLL